MLNEQQTATKRGPLAVQVAVVVALAVLALLVPAPAASSNPVTLPVAADPTVIRGDNGLYYMYATADDWGDGQGFRHMTMWASHDLVDWMFLGNVFPRNPSWVRSGFLWAPHIVKRGSQYMLYYSNGGIANPCIGVAFAAQPEGPWTDLGRPVFCSSDVGVGGTIDPFVFEDGGAPRVVVGNYQGIYIVPLNGAGTSWTGGASVRIADNRFEAPEIHKRGSYYYLFASAEHCCNGATSAYRVLVGRSSSVNGPYVDRKGTDLNSKGGALILAGSNPWAGPGHSTIVTDEAGTDWLAYHAIPKGNPFLPSGANRRPMLIDKIVWANGWPEIGDGSPSSTRPDLPAVSLPVRVSVAPNTRTAFPRGGGVFTATVTVKAPANAGYSGQVWVNLALPNSTQTRIFGPVTVNLAPNQTYQTTISHQMRSTAPRGFYRFYAFAGTLGVSTVELGTATFFKSANRTAVNISAQDVEDLGIDEATYAAILDAGLDPQDVAAAVN